MYTCIHVYMYICICIYIYIYIYIYLPSRRVRSGVVRPVSVRSSCPSRRRRQHPLSVRLPRRPFRRRRPSSVRALSVRPIVHPVVVIRPLSVRPVIRVSITCITLRSIRAMGIKELLLT